MGRVLTSFPYFGGKVRLIQKLKDFFEDGISNCNTFIDGFAGSGVVTLNIDKDIFDRRIINDLNPRIFLIHKVLSDPTMAYKMRDLIEDTELSKDCFLKAKKVWEPYMKKIKAEFEPMMLGVTEASAFETQKDIWKKYVPEEQMIELAAAALVMFKQSFNGLGRSSIPDYDGNKDIRYYRWIDDTIDKVIEQMEGVEAYCVNTLVLINKYKNDPNVFMYLDSPYELKTRGSGKAYEVDMDDEDQERYIDTIIDAKAPIIISGYRYDGKSIYDKLADSGNWRCEMLAEDVAKSSYVASLGGYKPREDEWVWLNY